MYLFYFLLIILFFGSCYLVWKIYKESVKNYTGYEMRFYFGLIALMLLCFYLNSPFYILYFISVFITLFYVYYYYTKKRRKEKWSDFIIDYLTIIVFFLNVSQVEYNLDFLGIFCLIIILIQLILFYRSYNKLNAKY